MKTDQTGYASVPGLAYENQGWVTEVEGEIPNEMEGTLLRNGPARKVDLLVEWEDVETLCIIRALKEMCVCDVYV